MTRWMFVLCLTAFLSCQIDLLKRNNAVAESGQTESKQESSPSSVASDTSTSSTSRAELWKKQRQEKQKDIKPYKQKMIEKRLLYLEKKGFKETLGLHYKDLYFKVFGNLATGSGWSPGLRYLNHNINGTRLDLSASATYSLRGYQLYDFQFGNVLKKDPEFFIGSAGSGGMSQFSVLDTAKEGNLFLYADLQYRDFPQEDFFGLGGDSRKEDRTDFEVRDISYDAVAAYRFNRWFGASVRAGFLQVEIDRGTDSRFPDTQDLFSDSTAPGLDQQPDFIRTASTVFFDYRDRPGNPHWGGLLGFSYSRYDDRDGQLYEFNRFTFDARQYFPLGSIQRVLALQFYTSFDDAAASRQVPFYLMQTLGGSETLRGFREFRFRDKNLLYLSAEYRWEAAPAWELALFYDAGKVFADRSEFDFENLKRSYGFGVRFKFPTAVFMRIDIGRSNEGTRFFLKFGSSF